VNDLTEQSLEELINELTRNSEKPLHIKPTKVIIPGPVLLAVARKHNTTIEGAHEIIKALVAKAVADAPQT